MKPVPGTISGTQFAVFRIALGLYLAWHFIELVPYGAELFGGKGVLADPRMNPTFGLFPSPFLWFDSPAVVTGALVLLAVAAIALAAGVGRRAAAVVLWFGWAALFHRNNLISNPGLPYVGFLLVATAFVPKGEGLAWKRFHPVREWRFPPELYSIAWILLAAGYSYSGWVKLSSPSWLDGTAFMHVLENPLARSGPLRELASSMPPVLLKLATWGALAVELLALPLSVHRRTRAVAWTLTLGMQLGILLVVRFADLTLGMVLIHLFTLDPAWFPARKPRYLVLYDGDCGLCSGLVQFLLREDRMQVLRFAALQGETAATVLKRAGVEADLATMALVVDDGEPGEKVYLRSTAALRTLDAVGGFWRPVSWLRVVPAPVRDVVYRWVAANRIRWFGREDACRLATPEERQRFLP